MLSNPFQSDMSSAQAFTLDKTKILLFGKELLREIIEKSNNTHFHLPLKRDSGMPEQQMKNRMAHRYHHVLGSLSR